MIPKTSFWKNKNQVPEEGKVVSLGIEPKSKV